MTEIQFRLEPQGVEHLPLGALIELQERRLREGRVMERAATSSLYKRRWRRDRVQPGEVRTFADLQNLPFTTAQDLVAAQSGRFGDRLACSRVRLWFSTAGVDGPRKWVPYSDRDLRQIMGLWARAGSIIGVREEDLILAVSDPAPRISNSFPYLWAMMDKLETGLNLEFVVGSMFMVERNNWPEFALRKQPDVLLARPGDALALVDHFKAAIARADTRPKDVLKNLRAGIFFGEALGPSRQAIVEQYGLEPYDCYTSAEFAGPSLACAAHDGVHVWMDVSIPELIPKAELDEEEANPGYQPRAVALAEASPGLQGEFVVTTFSEALPLIRYRTGDLMEVVSTNLCSCGISHPRVRFLGRGSLKTPRTNR